MTDFFWWLLQQSLVASGVAVLLLAVKALFRDKLSPRWQFAIWGVLALRLLLPAGLLGRIVLWDWALGLEVVRIYLGDPAWVGALGGLYLAGAAGLLLWHLTAYLRLRLALGRGTPVSPEGLARVCQAYGLKPCRAVAVPGLPSAFLCGVFRPVLALPQGAEPDDKVLLHELLHRKYRDTAWGLLICLLRCLHWWNPLLQYCCDQALNDCEALCDQRVLERLEGEARRDYGHILLSMAAEQFARAPGTSSMANGGAQIKARIACIARFKRYPAGMALASVCVAVLLGWTCLVGTPVYGAPDFDRGEHPWSQARNTALALLRRCTTVAGAVDTYAKALLQGNPHYLAMVSPPGADLAELTAFEGLTPDYEVVSLRQEGEGLWQGWLALRLEGDNRYHLHPIEVYREEGWQVRPGPGRTLWGIDQDHFPTRHTYAAQKGDFSAQFRLSQSLSVDNSVFQGDGFFSQTAYDTAPRLHTQFDTYHTYRNLEVTYSGAVEGAHSVAVSYVPLPADWQPGDPPPELFRRLTGDASGSSSDGSGGASRRVDSGWNGVLTAGGGGSGPYEWGPEADLPPGYYMGIYWDGGLRETLYLFPQEVAS